MLLKQLIFLVLLAQTPHYRDTETWEAREARLSLVAEAIDDASLRATCQGPYAPPKDDLASCKRLWPGSRKTLSYLLVTQALHETHLSAEIHHNRCRLEIGECDSRWYFDRKLQKRVYVQQSFSLWQLKQFRDIPNNDWDQIQLGQEGTQVAAWHAARRLASAYRACGSIEGAISRYALGNGCEWAGARERAQTYRELSAAVPYTLRKNRDAQREKLLEKEQLLATSD